MAIPTNADGAPKPLIIKDFEKRTLRQNRALFAVKYNIDDFYQFLIEHVDHAESWTLDEIGALTVDELDAVHDQLYDAFEKTPPLAK